MANIIDARNLDLEQIKKDMTETGYAHVRGLLNAEEVAEISDMFEKIHREGIPGFYEPKVRQSPDEEIDILDEWPRVMHPHRHNDRARHYMVHPKVRACLEAFFGAEPLAAQSMFYFKPPGARGQALHQDNFYLLVQPGTCMAAWTAIDDCDAENGAMMVVSETQEEELACPERANEKVSFTSEFVPVPKGKKAQLVEMKAGDTLFFNGSVIHGSGPNRSKDRFRRAFICHYASSDSQGISRFYSPLVTMDGKDQEIPDSLLAIGNGGPCGSEWKGAIH